MTGIYKIESSCKPDRCYVGSAKDIKIRWWAHLTDLRKGKHHSVKLQNHYNKYGEPDLVLIILELCFPEFLTAREQYYINKLNPQFNICKVAGNCMGRKFSEESKKKMSNFRMGKEPWNKGKKLGYTPPTSFKKGDMVGEKNNFFGKHHSEEAKRKNTERHKGKSPWNKGKKGFQKAWNKGMRGQYTTSRKGRPMADEQRGKLRVAWIRRKQSPKYEEERRKVKELWEKKKIS